MSVFISKLLKSRSLPNKNNLARSLSTTEFKLSENDVEEIKIPVPWGHIAGKWWGDKQVAPVLAIHGWQDNANSFDKLIPLLNIPSVLAIDLPGHGHSSHLVDGKPYDFGEHVIILHRIKKHFNWVQVPLLTHSLGAAFGYGYAAMFPNEVKWLINVECSRTLLTLLRNDISGALGKGLDAFLEIEKIKKKPPPAYKLSKMIEMTIKGSLGSVASPEAALILLRRGIQVADKPVIRKDDEISGGLEDFIMYEKQALKALPKEESEILKKLLSQFTESVRKGNEKLKNFHLDEADDKYYVFNKDPSVKLLVFQSFDDDFIIEAAKSIKCPFLSLRAKQGFLFGSTRKLYEKTLDILKTSSKYLEHHDVDGTHHVHLNTPEVLAAIINNFIKECEAKRRKWWGPKDRRPILCVHGWQDNADTFNTLIPRLSSEFSYLAIDLPGHGLSSHIPKGFFYETYEIPAIIRRLQHYFDWTKVSLIGHSLGGVSSFLFSSLFPNSVDFFVAIDGINPVSKNSSYIKDAREKIEKLLFYDSRDVSSSPSYTKDELIKAWVKGTRNALTENGCKVLLKRGAREDNGLFKITRDPRVKFNIGVRFSHTDNLQLAESVTCNVLFLRATNPFLSEKKESFVDAINILKKKAKYFEEHLLKGTHYIHLNNPEVVAPVINSFVKTIGGQQGFS